LELFQADLTEDKAFDEAVHGCEYVLHVASPCIITVKDPQKDLVDPAVKGTLSALQAAVNDGNVKRVVVTSSVASVAEHGGNGKVYNESDWNDVSS
jgi:dihydroflavonol-4-reductase